MNAHEERVYNRAFIEECMKIANNLEKNDTIL